MPKAPSMPRGMTSEMKEMRAEDDLRTLGRAEEVRSDSKRMAACRRQHRKQQRTLTRVGRSLAGKGR